MTAAETQKWMKRDLAAAALLFVLVFGALLLGEKSVGFVRDEGIYFESGRRYAAWFLDDIPKHGLRAFEDGIIRARFETNREHPALMKILFGLSERLFSKRLGWVREATGFRLPALLLSALFAAAIFLFGRRVTSRRGAVFAALAFWLVPRTFFHGALSCFDMPIAFAWFLTIAAWRHCLVSRTLGSMVLAGLAFGFALAVKHNAWIIPGVLLIHWALATAPTAFRQGRFAGLLKSLLPFAVMLPAGVLVLFVSWPYLWHHPVERFLWYARFHTGHINYPWEYLGTLLVDPPFPVGYGPVLTALTVPAALFVLMSTGVIFEMARFAKTWVVEPLRRLRASRSGTPLSQAEGSGTSGTASPASECIAKPSLEPLDSDSLLLLGNGCASLFVFSMPFVPIFGGVKHWLPAMPFLCLLAARALERVTEVLTACLARKIRSAHLSAAVFGAVAAFVLIPALIGLLRIHPYGTSFYNEFAGGLPGAASLGMHRQYWSNNVTGVLDWINRHAPKRARVYLHEVTGYAFRDYKTNGMLRRDLVSVRSSFDADIAAYQYMPEFRDTEFQTWNAFGTMIPQAGLYLDETPQIVVYARPSVK